MKLAIEISEDEAAELTSQAQELGVSSEELAKSAVIDMLKRKRDFAEAANYVLKKNSELYKRLS